MSALVSNILTQTKSVISTELGATYQELPFIYDVSKNNLRRAEKAYGVRPLSALPTEGVTKVYTLDHDFEVILSDTFARGDSDSQRETALNTMYDKADEIFKALIATKINLAATVLHVFGPTLSEPEFFDDNKMVILRMQYTVKYRSTLD